MTTTTGTHAQPDLDLTPAAVILRAADVIARNGLAHEDYITAKDGVFPDEWPVDALGAIAIACGLHADAWEDDDLQHPELVSACEAADLLVLHLGLDPAKAYDETLGAWSDEHDAEHVVAEMRAAAQAVTA
jgi:hypothetical protein